MKRSTIIILAGISHNHPSPTGKISNRFYEILTENYDTKVLYLSNNPNHVVDIPNNYFPVIDPLMKIFYKKNGKRRLILYTLIRFLRKVRSLFNRNIYLNWYNRKASTMLNSLIEDFNISLIISFSSPFIAHITAKRFVTKYNIPWIAVTIDPLYLTNSHTTQNKLRYERSFFENCDLNFFTQEIFESKVKENFPLKIKYEILPYEIVDNTIFNSRINTNYNSLSLIYQGTFYKKIREPYHMIDTFIKMPINCNLYIYTRGKYEYYVKNISKETKNIHYRSFVSPSKIKEIMAEANIFVNIDNNSSDFAPSKLYEYISFGKPIINFYQKSENKILNKYPLQIQINSSFEKKDDQLSKILDFISLNWNKNIDYNQISSIFPQNTTKSIKSLICNNVEIIMKNYDC